MFKLSESSLWRNMKHSSTADSISHLPCMFNVSSQKLLNLNQEVFSTLTSLFREEAWMHLWLSISPPYSLRGRLLRIVRAINNKIYHTLYFLLYSFIKSVKVNATRIATFRVPKGIDRFHIIHFSIHSESYSAALAQRTDLHCPWSSYSRLNQRVVRHIYDEKTSRWNMACRFHRERKITAYIRTI